ncbi:unnamed protein product [Cladocopium goreaui]|uniref:Uncharacterized protein n=1 Tax=Cladocopium goreaui TaxID=2562237 RepID=A0A9P1DJQ1_9DINO|nr:unnamed protein product [Cladocopium goreaui]
MAKVGRPHPYVSPTPKVSLTGGLPAAARPPPPGPPDHVHILQDFLGRHPVDAEVSDLDEESLDALDYSTSDPITDKERDLIMRGHHPDYISRNVYKDVCRISMDRAKHCRKESVLHEATMKKVAENIKKLENNYFHSLDLLDNLRKEIYEPHAESVSNPTEPAEDSAQK